MPYTTAELVANAARNLEIKNGRSATLTPAQSNDFIRWADSVINSRLNALYFTPLIQIIRGDETKYPDPIEFIATNLAAGYAVEAIFARLDPNTSESGKSHKENALAELEEIANGVLVGSRRLDGQTRKSRNPFANPNAAPLESPNRQGF